MKREFLQNFKIGDQPLTKEIIDAIMAENGNDIEAANKPFADYDTIKNQLSEAQKTIKGFEDQDIEGVRKSAKEWEDKYNQATVPLNPTTLVAGSSQYQYGYRWRSRNKAFRALARWMTNA